MGRERKLRAWDKVAKKFLLPWPDGFHILGETTCFDLIGMQLKERSPEEATLEMLNDVELEQYTGLKDRVGAEIYEGDILKYVGTKCLTCERETIYPGHKTYPIVWLEKKARFECENKENWMAPDTWSEMEIIGTIHENPELLDG